MKNLIIIGSGPAGISAALYAVRAGIDTTVLHNGIGALSKAEHIQNYYGLSTALSGAELHEVGIKQAQALGVKLVETEVTGLGYDGRFAVSTSVGDLSADAVILATGSKRKSVDIVGATEFEGRGVSYCAVCDAFFYRKKAVAVFGSGEFALHEVGDLLPVVGKITVLLNGDKAAVSFPDGVDIIDKQIEKLYGENTLGGVRFSDGSTLEVSGLFIAAGKAEASDMARHIGAAYDKNNIVVDENMQTTVPGLFAAGDCIGGLLQVSAAVAEGAKAALSAIKFLKN